MDTTDDNGPVEDLEVEPPLVRVARLIFLGSLLFWPLFLAAVLFMLDAPAKSPGALVERRLLIDGTWLYPVAVGLAWFFSRGRVKKTSPDLVCLLPWLIPAAMAGYWLLYFFL